MTYSRRTALKCIGVTVRHADCGTKRPPGFGGTDPQEDPGTDVADGT